MRKVVLLFSPGLDSYLANAILSEKKDIELKRFYFDLDSRYSKNEVEFLSSRYWCEESPTWNNRDKVVHMRDNINLGLDERYDAYIPNRNLILVTAASTINPDADEIYINCMKDDRVSDSNKELFVNYSKVLSQSIGKKVEIKSLFWDVEKADAIREYTSNDGVALNLLMHTYSCFQSRTTEKMTEVYTALDTISDSIYNKLGTFNIKGCMSCPACFRRACALTAAGIYIPFLDKNLSESYRNKIDQKEHPSRYETVIKYLEFLEYANK
jgi:7-cyano-7-deazaguanine synthase in queuosine biosynthesis